MATLAGMYAALCLARTDWVRTFDDGALRRMGAGRDVGLNVCMQFVSAR
jgi:hypothetical protein